MKKILALCIVVAALLTHAAANATNCNAMIGLINQGFSEEEVAQAADVPVSVVDACRRSQAGAFRLNPAGPPPRNPAGPPPMNAAGSAPSKPWGNAPMNPAGIPK